jgi:phenylalanyl-tRNA synthetase beta chain
VEIVTPEGTYDPQPGTLPGQFSAKYLNEIMGTAIPKHSLGRVLSRMDLDVTGTDRVHVPTYRTDIFSEVDLAGDLLVALGIDSLQAEPLAVKFHWGMPTPCDSLCFGWATWPSAWADGSQKLHSYRPGYAPACLRPPTCKPATPKAVLSAATRTTLQAGLLDIFPQYQCPQAHQYLRNRRSAAVYSGGWHIAKATTGVLPASMPAPPSPPPKPTCKPCSRP